MGKRLAVLAIVINECSDEVVQRVNELLHEFRNIIVGRMGIPYSKRAIFLISIMLDGEEDSISALSGKLGMIKEVTVKTAYANSKK
ncbi:MAG: TM1266 family iron-only hydrogenase system putative regulator [Peptoniphilaceae bacterium]